MSFFAVLLALLLEQVKPLPRGNVVHDSLTGWIGAIARNFDAGKDSHAWVVWCITVLVPAVASAAVYIGLTQIHALLGLACDVAVLYLTLGFRQFSHYFTDIRAALERADEIEVLGSLPTYTTSTGFIVTPIVGLVQPRASLRPDPFEVAEVFEVPLAWLMNPANHQRHAIEVAGATRRFFSIPWQGVDANGASRRYFIWGATAAMLRNLYRFLAA